MDLRSENKGLFLYYSELPRVEKKQTRPILQTKSRVTRSVAKKAVAHVSMKAYKSSMGSSLCFFNLVMQNDQKGS